MISTTVKLILAGVLVSSLEACGGGSGGASSGNGAGSTNNGAVSGQKTEIASVPLVLSDASSEDWATIGVKVLSIALLPQGGGAAVTVYTAATPAPMINLEQLDQIGEILGNVSVPVGTYSAAQLTLSGNRGDIALTVAANPEAGFVAAAGTTIDPALIHIQNTQGVAPNLTVPLNVSFDEPLVVSATQSNALDLEFDLSHPAFIVGHVPAGSSQAAWAVNFNGPVRRHRIDDLTHLVLRHAYGDVTAVASDGTSLTMIKELPALPLANPETSVATSLSLQILADATNGTLFYDVDAKTSTTIKSFSSEAASLLGKFVRVAARYQEDGTLVATRVWSSSQFNSVWLSPEGHVLHVDAVSGAFSVANEAGVPVSVMVDSATQFFFRAPQNAVADSTPIGTGPAFLTSNDLVRGFKVHVSVVDPLATPLVAQSVDIETAAYEGRISAANATGFTYNRTFALASDDYSITLPYISATTPNGKDSNGNAIAGFKWWDFAYPTLATTGPNASVEFVNATNAGVSFGTAGTVSAWGASFAKWADPANPAGWSVPQAILVPTPMPLGVVATAYAANGFAMSVPGGMTPVTVDVSTTSGSATLVYQVDRTNGVVTVSPIDVTSSAGLASMTSGLVAGAPVKAYGVPQADGTLKAYVLLYFTGEMPSTSNSTGT